MKAILLATAMAVLLFVAVTLSFRVFPCDQRVKRMTQLYLVCAVALVAVWLVTSDDLGFIDSLLLAEPGWVDLALTLLFFSAAFFGGLLQLYNLADRGFSLRVLIDILESRDGGTTNDELAAGYGGGRGLVWMYDKRMHGLIEGGFVRRSGVNIVLNGKGASWALLFLVVRRFLRLKELVG